MITAASDGPPGRRLVAILATGIDGYGLSRRDDRETRRRVGKSLDAVRAAIVGASGTIISFAGFSLADHGVMAEFSSATEALQCALGIQAAAGRRTREPIRVRMGLTVGEILAGKRHIGGSAIRVAAELERIAPSGGIALPGWLHDQLRHVVGVPADPMGQPELGDLADPLVVVSIPPEACVAWAGGTQRVPTSPWRPFDPRVSLAVVPFRAGGAQGELGEAATDDVTRALGGLTTWLVVRRTPAAPIHTPIDLYRVRLASDARYVVHGSIEAEHQMLRLTVELNEAESGRVLWSDRFDERRGQETALRNDAVSRVSRAVPPLLLQRELERLALVPPDNLTAHDLALRAYSTIMQPKRESFGSAAAMLRLAEQRPEPHGSTRFAQVWWHLMAISQGWSADPGADARAAAEAADRMDHDDPAAVVLLAFMPSVSRDHGLMRVMLDQVIDAAPFCGLAESLKGLSLACLGQAEAAIRHAAHAQTMPALGPERAWRDQVTALAHYVGGHYADAVRWARVSAMCHPGLAANARVLTASLAVLGRLDEAHHAAQQLLTVDPNFRIDRWRRRSLLPDEHRDTIALRLRLAGLPT